MVNIRNRISKNGDISIIYVLRIRENPLGKVGRAS